MDGKFQQLMYDNIKKPGKVYCPQVICLDPLTALSLDIPVIPDSYYGLSLKNLQSGLHDTW